MSDCRPLSRNAAETYDLVVIGAGSAGFSAAITAAEEGARVALVGAGTIGGTCVNIGCVPSKALIRAVEPLHQARAASRFDGVRATAEISAWSEVIRQKCPSSKHLAQVWRGVNGERASSGVGF